MAAEAATSSNAGVITRERLTGRWKWYHDRQAVAFTVETRREGLVPFLTAMIVRESPLYAYSCQWTTTLAKAETWVGEQVGYIIAHKLANDQEGD